MEVTWNQLQAARILRDEPMKNHRPAQRKAHLDSFSPSIPPLPPILSDLPAEMRRLNALGEVNFHLAFLLPILLDRVNSVLRFKNGLLNLENDTALAVRIAVEDLVPLQTLIGIANSAAQHADALNLVGPASPDDPVWADERSWWEPPTEPGDDAWDWPGPVPPIPLPPKKWWEEPIRPGPGQPGYDPNDGWGGDVTLEPMPPYGGTGDAAGGTGSTYPSWNPIKSRWYGWSWHLEKEQVRDIALGMDILTVVVGAAALIPALTLPAGLLAGGIQIAGKTIEAMDRCSGVDIIILTFPPGVWYPVPH